LHGEVRRLLSGCQPGSIKISKSSVYLPLGPAVSHKKAQAMQQSTPCWGRCRLLGCEPLGGDALRDTVTAHVAPRALPVLPTGSFQAGGSFLGAPLLGALVEVPNQHRGLKEAPLEPFAWKQKALEALPACHSRWSGTLLMLQARK